MRLWLTHRAALRALAFAGTLAASLAVAWPVGACPSCAIGREARAEVWADGFGLNLFLGVVPFLIIGAVSAWANRIGAARKARQA